MSVRLLAKAFEAPDSLRGSNRLVLLALADHASEEGWCWPGVNRISKKAAIGRRQVQKCLAQLVETGFLEKHYRPGKTTMYRLTLVPDEGGELWDTGEPGDTPGVNCGTPKPLVNHQSPSSLGKEDGAGFDFWEGRLLNETRFNGRVGVLGEAFKHVFDREADYGRLGRLARVHRPIVVLRAIHDMGGAAVKGDAYAYLAQMMRNQQKEKTTPERTYQEKIMAEDMANLRGVE